VFNLSLSTAWCFSCHFWKESFVVPLFKSGDKREVFCYRGISILSVIPKIFEEMVCDRKTSVVLSTVISDAQHGFVRSRSNDVTNEIEDGWQIDEVYTEFPEAFDRVLHGLFDIQIFNFIWWPVFELDGVLSSKLHNGDNNCNRKKRNPVLKNGLYIIVGLKMQFVGLYFNQTKLLNFV
jgi:hypothetical protein